MINSVSSITIDYLIFTKNNIKIYVFEQELMNIENKKLYIYFTTNYKFTV